MAPGIEVALDTLPLWQNQKNALRTISTYIASGDSGACLVRMPTGTGKAGVIAVATQYHDSAKRILVLTPRANLRDQLGRDIAVRFWDHCNTDPPERPRVILNLLPSTLPVLLATEEQEFICLATLQTLQTIHAEELEKYRMLAGLVDLVIVDEGHAEPAPTWAEAVRGLQKPVVLFTATPFRNDHKLFAVSPKHIFAYTHKAALADRLVRDVLFQPVGAGDAGQFVDSVLHYYDTVLTKCRPHGVAQPRVIIRCETGSEVTEIAGLLSDRGREVVAVHDTYPAGGDEDEFHKKVPDPDANTAEFWVHQWKLLEGVDHPDFCLLALYQPLRNGRALVQQIGRVIRNPQRKARQRAHVLVPAEWQQKELWSNYLRYEDGYEERIDWAETHRLFDLTVRSQPEFQYYAGKFRDRLNIDASGLHERLQYRRSTNVYEVPGDLDVGHVLGEVEKEWYSLDLFPRERGAERPAPDTWVLVYVTMRNSGILRDDALTLVDVGFSVCRKSGQLLFFYDSLGHTPSRALSGLSPVPPRRLETLLSGHGARVSAVSLMNSDIGNHSIRRRTVHARDLEDTAPSLSDYVHFCSTAEGYTTTDYRGPARRYLGFTRGRITDTSSAACSFGQYVEWLDELARLLRSQDVLPLPLFERFAVHVPPPQGTDPTSILLDLEEVRDRFVAASDEQVPLEFEDAYNEVNDGVFTCATNLGPFDVTVAYGTAKQRYELSCKPLERAYVPAPWQDDVRGNLLQYLNRSQSFRVTPHSPECIYAHGHFYEPRTRIVGRGGSRTPLESVFEPLPVLADTSSEKGEKCSDDGNAWEAGCLFDLVDHSGQDAALSAMTGWIHGLVCDDLGTEVADFIATSADSDRVAFIHCKAFDKAKKRSASAFHEVCSQAVKNLYYLNPHSVGKPTANISKWNRPWSPGSEDGIIGSVRSRLRRGPTTGARMWGAISEAIHDPGAAREVWIVLGKGFSLRAFNTERAKASPAPEIVQIAYLVQSTWSAVSSVGAKFRILCSP